MTVLPLPITWSDSNEEAELSTIRLVEERLHIIFPKDYLECAIRWHGGTPSPNHVLIKAPHHIIEINYLLTFAAFDELDILDWWNTYKVQLGERIVPIATTSENGLICFDYREGPINPTVVYWDKSSLIPVCKSFSDILIMLL
ncbi:hypothetical protein D3C73_972200 [compost metagenome]